MGAFLAVGGPSSIRQLYLSGTENDIDCALFRPKKALFRPKKKPGVAFHKLMVSLGYSPSHVFSSGLAGSRNWKSLRRLSQGRGRGAPQSTDHPMAYLVRREALLRDFVFFRRRPSGCCNGRTIFQSHSFGCDCRITFVFLHFSTKRMKNRWRADCEGGLKRRYNSCVVCIVSRLVEPLFHLGC